MKETQQIHFSEKLLFTFCVASSLHLCALKTYAYLIYYISTEPLWGHADICFYLVRTS